MAASSMLSQLIEIFDNDFSLFPNSRSDKCNYNDSNLDSIIQSCDHLKRLTIGLRFHYLVSQSIITQSKLVQFCQGTYTNLLDDYFHFIECHYYHLREIQNEIQLKFPASSCGIINCELMTRHYRQSNLIIEDTDLIYSYYMDCFDRLHHQIHHITRLGLRFQQQLMNNSGSSLQNVHMGSMIDNRFHKMKDTILNKREQFRLLRFNRHKQQSRKFNLTLSQSLPKESFTNTVELGNHLQIKLYQSNTDIPQSLLTDVLNENEKLQVFIVNNDYDTDAVIHDLDDLITENELEENELKNQRVSNLYTISTNTEIITELQKRIRDCCMWHFLSLVLFDLTFKLHT